MARWYARVRGSGSQIEAYRKQAGQLTAGLPSGARVLEVAPGPGYLAIEMARARPASSHRRSTSATRSSRSRARTPARPG